MPFAAGGGSDIVARLVGDRLSKRLQQTVIIENKPGAGAIIGADSVAKSAPDGYTLLFATPGPQILNPYLIKSLPYDPKDFAGVATLLKSVNLMVVSPNVPAKTVRELIDYSKANPGKLNFAIPVSAPVRSSRANYSNPWQTSKSRTSPTAATRWRFRTS